MPDGPVSRRRVLAAAIGTAAVASRGASAAAVRDASGREIALPDRIARVFPAGPPAAILLYTLAPDLLTGWPARPPSPAEAAFLTPEAAALPQIGRITGRDNSANLEAVLANRPDLVLDYGSTGPTYASLADRVMAQTGLPALLLDGALTRIPATYRLLGAALGRADRAERLAAASDAILSGLPRAGSGPTVLYLRGPRGAETALDGSISAEAFALAGARNVAADPGTTRNLAPVSPEQALAWNPDWVVAQHPDFVAHAARDPVWRAMPAVRAGRLALVPALPFGWVDFPPSVNRLLGLLWLPALFGAAPAPDLRARILDFHALFYGRTPGPAALDTLLRDALPRRA